MRPWMLSFVVLSGCAGAAASAIANTAVAVTVSAVRRSQGECYTVCNPGHACNKATGTCEPLPCGGQCGFDQKCVLTPTGEQCVNAKAAP
jgi:hypothetical protein